MANKVKIFHDKTENIFNKRFKLKSKNENYLPPHASFLFSTTPNVIEPLQKLKIDLNSTKNLLNTKDIEKWRRHTSQTNPCGLVVKHLRNSVKPELCTQAWAKFYEILSTHDIIPENSLEKRQLVSLHLCEAPGAFVTSLNHYLKTNYHEINWQWIATTLNPFYEGNNTKQMISGEKFIIETLEHWHFGMMNNGDLMEVRNLECLTAAIPGGNKADLVTADGSVSCADEPDKQEMVIAQLLYCEVVTAIMNLVQGGSLVVKMFTMFEHQTLSILYLLSCFFQEVEIVKPGTSKPGNSEVYCVCTCFLGEQWIPRDMMMKLQDHYLPTLPQCTLFPNESLPVSFIEKIVQCAKMFSEFQIAAIKSNLELFEHFTRGKWKFINKLRSYVAEEYIKRFDIQHVCQESFVVRDTYLDGTQLSCWPEGSYETHCNSGIHHTGSYVDRVAASLLDWHEKVVKVQQKELLNDDSIINEILHSDCQLNWLECEDIPTDDIQNWRTSLGKTIEEVHSSKFCPVSLISELKEAKKNALIIQNAEGQVFMQTFLSCIEERCHQLKRINPVTSLHVLQMSGVVNLESQSHNITDISENSRLISELSQNGVCHPEHCSSEYLCDSNIEVEYCKVKINTYSRHYDEMAHLSRDGVTKKRDPDKRNYGIIFASVFGLDETECMELSTKISLVKQCYISLQLLQPNDCLVLEISTSLTQFTVGVIYLLHHLFHQISITAPVFSVNFKQFIVCRSFIHSRKSIIIGEHFRKLLTELNERAVDRDVISLLPIKLLFAEKFYKYIRTQTTSNMKQHLNMIIYHERLFLSRKSRKNPDDAV